MKRIVLNASQNRDGHSLRLATQFLAEQEFQTVNLVDYRIDQIGQVEHSDQLSTVLKLLTTAEQLIITTPIYWSDMPGYLKTFIDRSGDPSSNRFKGIQCFLLIQGAAPDDAIQPVSHVVEHWATRNQMQFMGAATYSDEVKTLQHQL